MQLHSEMQQRREFWGRFHRFNERIQTPMSTFPMIGFQPLDIFKLYREVESRGGPSLLLGSEEEIKAENHSSKEDIKALKWSPQWEEIFRAVLPENMQEPLFDPQSESCVKLGDPKCRREKFKFFYEKYVLPFQGSSESSDKNSSSNLGSFFRCVCGHNHELKENFSCVTCEEYLDVDSSLFSEDQVQCEACGAWQHIQCLVEEGIISQKELELLDNAKYHFYCEMCSHKSLPCSWSSKILARELPVDWTCERRFRPNSNKPGPDYYMFRPNDQLKGRFSRLVIRSVVELDEILESDFKELEVLSNTVNTLLSHESK